jgi:hypothetical protein
MALPSSADKKSASEMRFFFIEPPAGTLPAVRRHFVLS